MSAPFHTLDFCTLQHGGLVTKPSGGQGVKLIRVRGRHSLWDPNGQILSLLLFLLFRGGGTQAHTAPKARLKDRAPSGAYCPPIPRTTLPAHRLAPQPPAHPGYRPSRIPLQPTRLAHVVAYCSAFTRQSGIPPCQSHVAPWPPHFFSSPSLLSAS